MSLIRGFDPIVAGGARILVLGTLPGKLSLKHGEYYANPNNAFWRVAEAYLDTPRLLPYSQRVASLKQQGVALWDVLASGEREGSSDKKIVRSTATANDFAGFFSSNTTIASVVFNGGTAQQLFDDLVLPLQALPGALRRIQLPSTSPQNTHLTLEQKLDQWSILRELLVV